MTKVLLFDFDGTIADSYESFLEIVKTLSQKYNLPELSPEELEELRSEEASAVLKKLKIPFFLLPLLAIDMRKLQSEHIMGIKPFPGLSEVLHQLKTQGIELGILTSNGKDNVEVFLKTHGIDMFKYIYTDSSMFGKDAMIRKFLKQSGVSMEEVMYVGDEIRDIQACRKVGIPIISVTWGFNSKAGLTKHNPDFLIDSPHELVKLVK